MEAVTIPVYELIRVDRLGKDPLSYSLGLFLDEKAAKARLEYYAGMFGLPRKEDSEFVYTDKVTELYITTRKLELYNDN